MQLNKFQNDRNPRGRPKGRGVAWYLKQIGEEEFLDTKTTKNELVARMMFKIALDPETKPQDATRVASDIMDRQDGKPVNTILNADITENPFEGIDTAKLEALRTKLMDTVKTDGK